MLVIAGYVPFHPLEADPRLDMLQIHPVGVGTVDPSQVRHHLAVVMNSWLVPLIGFLMDSAGFSGRFQHDGLAQDSPVPIELKAHEVKRPAKVFTLDGVGETKHLPVSFQLQTEIFAQIAGDGLSDLVQNFLV